MRPDVARRTAGKSITLRRLAQPWTLILIITGLFQLFRGAPVDAAFFLCIAALLLADAVGWLRLSVPVRPRAAWLLAAAVPLAITLILAPRHGVVEGIIVSAIGVTVLIFGWGASESTSGSDADGSGSAIDAFGSPTGTSGSTTSTSARSTASLTASLTAGSATSAAGVTSETAGRTTMSPAVRRSAILWSVVGVVTCLWEVASFLLGLPSPEAAIAHPSISELFDPILDTTAGRAVFIALWLLLGGALVRRGAHTITVHGDSVRIGTGSRRKKVRR